MEFNPALPLPIKWNIGDDRFNEGQQVLSLTIPVDSVTHLIDHLQNLVNTKAKEGEVYDFAKKEKVSISLAGGTHHARYEQASGFCLFNDVAIAAISELRTNSKSRVLIIDCDVHQGDGTAEILLERERAYTLSIHSARNFPHKKANSDCDIELQDGTEDIEYLEKLSDGLSRVKDEFDPSLVFFNAGVDVHKNDRLGRLHLSTEGLRQRDAMVYDLARTCSASLVGVMGGGYGSSAAQIAGLHYQTVVEAYRSWESINMDSESLAK